MRGGDWEKFESELRKMIGERSIEGVMRIAAGGLNVRNLKAMGCGAEWRSVMLLAVECRIARPLYVWGHRLCGEGCTVSYDPTFVPTSCEECDVEEEPPEEFWCELETMSCVDRADEAADPEQGGGES